jgi:predicted glycosyltransferase
VSAKRDQTRLLIYSHDTFGLGHLRRCTTIAHSLVDYRKDLSVLILSGSPIIGSFDFRPRVDFVRIPGVIKLRDGNYTSRNLAMGIDEIVSMRASMIRHMADVFRPDVMLVDKEPWGLRGEMADTLTMLKTRGASLVLGLRDVMDDAQHLSEEWGRKNAMAALEDVYDHVWVYGLRQIYDPLAGMTVSNKVRRKMRYTGYLRREEGPTGAVQDLIPAVAQAPYILVTTGGGGDGAKLIDWVLRAYEHDPGIPHPALLVLGPFMRSTLQAGFMQRVDRLPQVHAITFNAHMETLMSQAGGIVSMGGYNTFCEILSFDKPSVIVPRRVPRLEQHIRTLHASQKGLVGMLPDDGERDPQLMAAALRGLLDRPKPSATHIPGLLDGLSAINSMFGRYLDAAPAASRFKVVDSPG